VRARAIKPGHGYWVRVRIEPVTRCRGSWGFPGWVGRQRAIVVDVLRGEPGRPGWAVVKAERWVCVNAHQFGADVARALVDGLLRYRRAPHRWTVPVRDVLAPAQRQADVDATTPDHERTDREREAA
jgi:hypothetical protein